MRRIFTLTLIAFTAAASAQSLEAPTPSSRSQQVQAQLQARFASADVDLDGWLTREEANGKMPFVAMNFDSIDKHQAGYVTLEQIQSYALEQHRARRDNTSSLLLYR